MSNLHTSTFSPASADLQSPPRGQGSAPLVSRKLTRMPLASSAATGQACPTTEMFETCPPIGSGEQRYLQADFLANHSALPGSAGAREMTVRSGRKCCELLQKSDPIGCFVRTFLESSTWNSNVCFLTWKASVFGARRRLLFRLAPSAPTTSARAFGFWPTPCAGGDHWGGTWVELGGSKNWMRHHPLGKQQVNPGFWEWLLGFPKDFTALDAAPSATPSSRKSPKSSSAP